MDLGVFYEVIVPLMEMRGAATICISTPVSSWNFYTELTEIRDDKGELLFNVIKVGMVCGRCEGTEREAECTHPTGDRPEWKTETSEKVRAIYGHRKTLMLREVMGKVADDENMAFEARDLKAFFRRTEKKEPHDSVREVYIAVDPNGGASAEGGTGSQSAVVSFYLDGANVVVSQLFQNRRGHRLLCLRVEELHTTCRPRVAFDVVIYGAQRVGWHERHVVRVDFAHERTDAPFSPGSYVVVHAHQTLSIQFERDTIHPRSIDGRLTVGIRIRHIRTEPFAHILLDEDCPVDAEHLQLFRHRRRTECFGEKSIELLSGEHVVFVRELVAVPSSQCSAQLDHERASVSGVAGHDERGHPVVGAHSCHQLLSSVVHVISLSIPLALMRLFLGAQFLVGAWRRRRRRSIHLTLLAQIVGLENHGTLSTISWSRHAARIML